MAADLEIAPAPLAEEGDSILAASPGDSVRTRTFSHAIVFRNRSRGTGTQENEK
jgi:hypothetical protein